MREGKPLSIRAARSMVKDASKADAVRQELEAIAGSEITDVVTWTGGGFGEGQAAPTVTVTASADIPPRARKAIKKIKVTPGQYGDTIEIEMHDKMAALRLLARTEGLLDGDDDVGKRPTLVGINIRGPVDAAVPDGDADGA
jgi:hypothetical protein